jgi:hypothetical protein
MRRLALGMVALVACKGSEHKSAAVESPPPPRVPPADAAPPPADANLDGCRTTVAELGTVPAAQRAQAVIGACQPCGDWKPLLDWNTPAAEGGPHRKAIEDAMIACVAYCDLGAKQRFLGTLDDARGQSTRQPWRLLGEICGAKVSAVPDARFMSAPLFALDRIARALGVASPIEIPLPAVSASGVGLDLPTAAPASPGAGPLALTIAADHLLLGTLPTAKLSATGLVVKADYPGTPVELRRLASALGTPGAARPPTTLIAPPALPATRIAEVIAAAAGSRFLLAVAQPGPGGWTLPGTLSIDLVSRRAGPALRLGASADAAIHTAEAADVRRGATITVDDDATVASLATLLGALASHGAPSAAVVSLAPARLRSAPKP